MPDVIDGASVAPITDKDLESIAANTGDNAEHMAEMIKKVDGANDPDGKTDANSDQGDKLLAGKYKDEQALSDGFNSLVEKFGQEKAYKILESAIGQPNDGKSEADSGEGDALSPDTKTEGDVLDGNTDTKTDGEAGEGDSKPLDFDAFSKEYQENGELSADSIKALEAGGVNQTLLNEFISGQEAKAELNAIKITGLAGGEENYNTMIEWAGENLDDNAIGIFNDAIRSGDMAQIDTVMTALKSRYEASEGTLGDRTRVTPTEANSATKGGYESSAQMKADMKDPRYKTDKAFRAMVMRKISNSPNLM